MAVDAVTRQEQYMQYMAGDSSVSLPEPVTRLEKYWYNIANRLGSGTGGGTGGDTDDGTGGGTVTPSGNYVSTDAQELTEEQKQQARDNIEVFSWEEIRTMLASYVNPTGRLLDFRGEWKSMTLYRATAKKTDLVLYNGKYYYHKLPSDGEDETNSQHSSFDESDWVLFVGIVDSYSKDEIDAMFGSYVDEVAALVGGIE